MSWAPFAPDRWRRIEELFHACLDLPEDCRADLIGQSCGSDECMRREIESLLAADDQESPVIAGIIDQATITLLVEGDDDGLQ